MDTVVGKRFPEGAELFVCFSRAMDTDSFPTSFSLTFLFRKSPSVRGESFVTDASHRAASGVVVVQDEHDGWMKGWNLQHLSSQSSEKGKWG